jgi:hypothetical protein
MFDQKEERGSKVGSKTLNGKEVPFHNVVTSLCHQHVVTQTNNNCFPLICGCHVAWLEVGKDVRVLGYKLYASNITLGIGGCINKP